MLPLSHCDGVLPADGGTATRGLIGRPSSLVTVLGVAQVGGATAAVAATSGTPGSLSDEALDVAAAGERLRLRKKQPKLLGLQHWCLRQCV